MSTWRHISRVGSNWGHTSGLTNDFLPLKMLFRAQEARGIQTSQQLLFWFLRGHNAVETSQLFDLSHEGPDLVFNLPGFTSKPTWWIWYPSNLRSVLAKTNLRELNVTGAFRVAWRIYPRSEEGLNPPEKSWVYGSRRFLKLVYENIRVLNDTPWINIRGKFKSFAGRMVYQRRQFWENRTGAPLFSGVVHFFRNGLHPKWFTFYPENYTRVRSGPLLRLWNLVFQRNG